MKKFLFSFLATQYCLAGYTQNVGIGITNPDFKLTIKSTEIQSNTNTNLLKLIGQNPTMLLSNGTADFGYIKAWTYQPYAPFTNGLVIGTPPGNPIFLSTNYGATMVIADNNNVGIGLTAPRCKLTVLSNTVAGNNNTEVLQVAGKNAMEIFSDANGNDFGYLKAITDRTQTNQFSRDGLEIGTGGGNIYLTALGYQPALTVDGTTNNVGIGTNNPTYKLSVNGTIRAKELRINTGWADYVFHNNYKLMALPEVEQYILKNKHLPGIAPASKLQKEGVGISEMQTKMMAKIEELTLYLIAANKRIEKLERLIRQKR